MQSDQAPEAVIQAAPNVAVPRPRWRTIASAGTRAAYTAAGLFIFILALELLKTGARGLRPILEDLSADGVLNLLGFGWLGSYIVMSGSPVAAISLSLFSSGTVSDTEAFAMINGSRLGASFIVLFVGFILWLTRKRSADGLYIGVVALLTAFTLWLPVLPIGVLILNQGWFDSIEVGTPGAITSFVDVAYDPIVQRISDVLPTILVFAVGIGTLLAAFAVFDRALPNLEQPSLRVESIKDRLHHPLAMFALGIVVTAMTLSVSISLTLLIPLSLKGYIRRDAIIPYVMGANIATWVDTLVASLLLDTPRAFTIVFTEMVVGAAISLFILLFLYKPYSAALIATANRVTHSKTGFAAFMAVILVVPLVLFLI
jgi:solute carrier family 34 (sodium-dependent phosphate cotransporter)